MTDKKNKSTDTKANDQTALVAFANDDQFVLTDGADIPGGWNPSLREGVAEVVEKIRAERIEKNKVVDVSMIARGTLGYCTAWQKQAYCLNGATTSDGKSYDQLRLMESSVLYKALANKRLGARVQIAFKGTVPIAGTTRRAHRWEVKVVDPATNQLSRDRADALILESEEVRDLKKEIADQKDEFQVVALKAQLDQMKTTTKRLANGDYQDPDDIFGARDPNAETGLAKLARGLSGDD